MGLRLAIYRQAGCELQANLTDQVNHITVVNVSGPFNPSPDAPGFRLITHDYYKNIPLLVPADLQPFESMRGPMFGGNYAACSGPDWRDAVRRIAGSDWSVMVDVHDRFEVVP